MFLGSAVVKYLYLGKAKSGTLGERPGSSTSWQGVMLTFPGNTVPTEGEMVMGELGGSRNSKDVGPTGVASSEPIRGTEWVSLFMLRCELITYSVDTEVSYRDVAENLIW